MVSHAPNRDGRLQSPLPRQHAAGGDLKAGQWKETTVQNGCIRVVTTCIRTGARPITRFFRKEESTDLLEDFYTAIDDDNSRREIYFSLFYEVAVLSNGHPYLLF